ncbi:MAG: metallophosphoesterase [Paracoccaceae bacterium]|nr:metallophosphoesterase [Paracoccaceae bacterium]
MKLLHFTDIHLTTPGQTIADRDPNANFDRALAHAMEAQSDAEALFITGDLSDWGEEDDYRRLKVRIGKLPMPVHLAIGNHDDRATFLRVFPELAGEGGFVHYTAPLSLGHAVVLDTWGPETHAGHFCAARAAWLDRTLAALPGPVWLFLHHNPVPVGIGPIDEIMLLDAERFATTLAPHAGRIAHIFHGHCHLPLAGSLLGIPFSAPRGTNHQGWPDFGAERLLSGSDLPEAYGVVLASPRSTMVHMVEYGYQGEIRSEGSPDYAAWDKLTMIR